MPSISNPVDEYAFANWDGRGVTLVSGTICAENCSTEGLISIKKSKLRKKRTHCHLKSPFVNHHILAQNSA